MLVLSPSQHLAVLSLDTSLWGFTDEYERSGTAEHAEKQKLTFTGWLACLHLEWEWCYLKSCCCVGISQSNFWNLLSGAWWVGPSWQPNSHPASHSPSSFWPGGTGLGNRTNRSEKAHGLRYIQGDQLWATVMGKTDLGIAAALGSEALPQVMVLVGHHPQQLGQTGTCLAWHKAVKGTGVFRGEMGPLKVFLKISFQNLAHVKHFSFCKTKHTAAW